LENPEWLFSLMASESRMKRSDGSVAIENRLLGRLGIGQGRLVYRRWKDAHHFGKPYCCMENAELYGDLHDRSLS
jgi:hypothetical protein